MGGELLYYNVEIRENDSDSLLNPAIYSQQNTTDVLTHPDEYLLSVDRFSISTAALPIAVLIPSGNPLDANELIYKVSLSYNGFTATAPVIYVPTFLNLTPVDEGYYYLYTYSAFIRMINEAFKTALIALKILAPAIPLAVVAPCFIFDPVTSLISLVAQKAYYDETISFNTRILIQGNNALLKYFDSFVIYHYTYSISSTIGFRWAVFNKHDSNTYPHDNTMYMMMGDYTMLTSWNSLNGIQFTLYGIPINYEFVSNTDASRQTVSNPILTDFLVLYSDTSAGAQARTSVDYATSERRFVEIKGKEPLRSIQIQIFWMDNLGVRRQLNFYNGTSCSLKLLFKRKDLNY